MVKIMKNTFKVLLKQKSVLFGIILIPTILTLVFSFLLGSEMNYVIGVVDNDDSLLSKNIIKTIEDTGTASVKHIDYKKVDSALVGKESEIVVVIPKGYTDAILKGNKTNITIKSVTDSEIKASISSIINSKTNDYYSLSLISNGDFNLFEKLLDESSTPKLNYEINELAKKGVNVGASIGMVIMIIFTTSFFITKFMIDDEKQGTRDRILLGKVSKLQYYGGTLLVFFLCSSITSIIYYVTCNVLGFDFGTNNSIYYLYVLFAINFLSIAFNLALISFSSSPIVASNLASVLIISLSMLSGLFWPFSFMPDAFQKIGNLIPARWAMIAFENIQKNCSFFDIVPAIISIVGVGIGLLLLTVLVQSKKQLFNK